MVLKCLVLSPLDLDVTAAESGMAKMHTHAPTRSLPGRRSLPLPTGHPVLSLPSLTRHGRLPLVLPTRSLPGRRLLLLLTRPEPTPVPVADMPRPLEVMPALAAMLHLSAATEVPVEAMPAP